MPASILDHWPAGKNVCALDRTSGLASSAFGHDAEAVALSELPNLALSRVLHFDNAVSVELLLDLASNAQKPPDGRFGTRSYLSVTLLRRMLAVTRRGDLQIRQSIRRRDGHDVDRQMPSALGAAVELRLGKIRAGQAQDFVGLAQLAVLALQGLNAFTLFAGRPRTLTHIGLRCTANLRRGRLNGGPLGRIVVQVLQNNAHGTFTDLRGVGRSLSNSLIFSRVEAPTKPRVIQYGAIAQIIHHFTAPLHAQRGESSRRCCSCGITRFTRAHTAQGCCTLLMAPCLPSAVSICLQV